MLVRRSQKLTGQRSSRRFKSKTYKDIIKKPPHIPNQTFLKVYWWNGGGKIRTRIKANPELKRIIEKSPDIFVYGEAETPSSYNLNISGYICYLHRSKLNEANNFRRGIAIFYLQKYRFVLSKVYACNNYDIVWMRMKTAQKVIHFCFFYSPGAHHLLSVRKKFYDLFTFQFSKFACMGNVYLLGDTNARLGSLVNDRDINDNLVTNLNQPLLKEFLDYSGVSLLNSIYCKGVPTYEIANKKRSIIDMCFTNAPQSICSFSVDPKPLGVN